MPMDDGKSIAISKIDKHHRRGNPNPRFAKEVFIVRTLGGKAAFAGLGCWGRDAEPAPRGFPGN